MSCQKVLSLIISLTLGTLLLVGCSGPHATQVLLTPVPEATSTPVQATAIPVPTDTPAPPTTAPTAALPAVMPTVVQDYFFNYGVTITNDGGWMTVLSAFEDVGSLFVVSADEAPLQVVIDLWKAFSDEELGAFEGKVLLVDSEGNQYRPLQQLSFESLTLVRSGKSITIDPKENGFGFVFVVPRNTRGFKFVFHDFPPFDLGYPLPSTATPTVSPTAPPASAIGSVQGVLIGDNSNQPIADAYILLCTVVDPAASEPECLLRAGLATVTGADGKFEFASVPEGTYVVVYGLPDEVKGDPQDWSGRSVSYLVPVTVDLGIATDPFGGTKRMRFSGRANRAEDGDLTLNTGSVTSLEWGLSMEYREREPLTVSVTAGQTAQVTVEVIGH